MNCYVHSDRSVVAACVGCGKFICEECRIEVQNKNYCKACVNELVRESKEKAEKAENNANNKPMVFMNAGGGASSSASSSTSSSSSIPVSSKSKVVAGILAIFLGGIGAHKFYLRQYGMGFLYLIFCWTGIPAIIGLIEGIGYLISSDQAFAIKYR